MDKAERKAEKKLINFRADSETISGLDELATLWGCSQTGVIVRAVRECCAARYGGKDGDTRMDEVLEFVRSAPSEMEEAVFRAIARWKSEKPRLIPDESGPHDLIPPRGGALGTILVRSEEKSATVNIDSDLLPCRHCGTDGQIHPRAGVWRGCADCQRDGHTNFLVCRRCGEIERARKLAASPTGVDDPNVSYDWKDPV